MSAGEEIGHAGWDSGGLRPAACGREKKWATTQMGLVSLPFFPFFFQTSIDHNFQNMKPFNPKSISKILK